MIECATVNAVTIGMSGRTRRNGMMRQQQEQQMIGAFEDVIEPHHDEARGRVVPARIEPHQSCVAFELIGAHDSRPAA